MAKIKINSLEDAEKEINRLSEKMAAIEERELIRDSGLAEEIIHLRKETQEGFQNLRNEIKGIDTRLDTLTLESKVHTEMFKVMTEKLDEISKKLD